MKRLSERPALARSLFAIALGAVVTVPVRANDSLADPSVWSPVVARGAHRVQHEDFSPRLRSELTLHSGTQPSASIAEKVIMDVKPGRIMAVNSGSYDLLDIKPGIGLVFRERPMPQLTIDQLVQSGRVSSFEIPLLLANEAELEAVYYADYDMRRFADRYYSGDPLRGLAGRLLARNYKLKSKYLLADNKEMNPLMMLKRNQDLDPDELLARNAYHTPELEELMRAVSPALRRSAEGIEDSRILPDLDPIGRSLAAMVSGLGGVNFDRPGEDGFEITEDTLSSFAQLDSEFATFAAVSNGDLGGLLGVPRSDSLNPAQFGFVVNAIGGGGARVPEPSTLAYLLVAVAGFSIRRYLNLYSV